MFGFRMMDGYRITIILTLENYSFKIDDSIIFITNSCIRQLLVSSFELKKTVLNKYLLGDKNSTVIGNSPGAQRSTRKRWANQIYK